MDDSNDHDSLKIGDIITFECFRFNSFLSAEGILVETVAANNALNDFDDAKFCVHLQRQYSAAKEFSSFLESNDSDGDSGYFQALKIGRDNELKLNDKDMQQKIGFPVSFGDIIQLYHIKSNKYLTIVPGKSAQIEKENLRISLDSIGSTMSWMQIVPRYKVDKEGDRILNLNEVYIKFPERPNEYLHCADRNPDLSSQREVNCSMESTSWRLGIFQSSLYAKNPSLLLVSQLVYLHDPESRCNMKLNLIPLKPPEEHGSGSTVKKYQKELPVVVLGPTTDSQNIIDSNSLWYLESLNNRIGGPVSWKTDSLRFRHLNTGLYLKLAPRKMRESTTSLDPSKLQNAGFIYKTTFDVNDPNTRFKLHDVTDSSKFLSNSKPYKLEQDGLWLKFDESFDSKFPRINPTTDEFSGMPLVLIRYEEPAREEASTAMKEPLDILAGISAKNYLATYIKLLRQPTASLGEIWSSEKGLTSLDTFQLLLERLIVFCLGFPLSSVEIDLSVDKINPKNRVRCQTLLRDQGVIESILILIQRLGSRKQIIQSKKRTTHDEESSHIEIQKRVLSICLEVIYYCLKENIENQLYIADCLSVLLAYLGNSQPMAGASVTEMLRKNMKLQRTKIGPREIGTFIDKLKNSKMNSLYLGLLRSCCSCEGVGVVRNQRIISEHIYSDSPDSLIILHSNTENRRKLEWGTNGSFFLPTPSSELTDQHFLGHKLFRDGLPRLDLTWKSHWENMSCLFLFKKNEVQVETLFPSSGSISTQFKLEPKAVRRLSLNVATKSNTINPFESAGGPQIIVKYFIAQLHLSAELCLGRNYSVMNSLVERFPFDNLVTMLKLDVSSSLKAAAIRLVLYLYIDRDPQIVCKLPRFIRSWNELKDTNKDEFDPKLPSTEQSLEFKFALVQDIILDHLKQICGKQWSEYTNHVIDTLHHLILFGFYGSHSKLKETFIPLVCALDRRSIEATPIPEDNSIPTKKGGKGRDPPNKTKTTATRTELNDESEESEYIEEVVWQQKLLELMESLRVMLFILSLVIIAVGLLVYQTLSNAPDGPGTALYYVGIIILSIFCADVTTRAYCYFVVKGEILSFLLNVYNQIDVLVVLIDIIFLCVPFGANAKFAKTLRLIRLLRLLRILRAGRVINRLAELAKVVMVDVIDRSRYNKASSLELETIERMIDVLLTIEKIDADRNISLLLHYFNHIEQEKELDSTLPNVSSFIGSISSHGLPVTHEVPEFDSILIDIAMYHHPPVTQKALELLMEHHSTWDSLLENKEKLQLIVTSRQEAEYKSADKMIRQLRYNVETFDLWYRLENESQKKTSKQTIELLQNLVDKIKVPAFSLKFDVDYVPNIEIQNMLQDLGCLGICMKILNLAMEVTVRTTSGPISSESQDTILAIASQTNVLLSWFLNSNITNQNLAFPHFDFFVDLLDSGTDSHLVLWSMFIDNEPLIKRVPFVVFSEMISKVCKLGHKHPFIFFLTALTHVGEKGMTDIQLRIAMLLTSQANLSKITSYLCSVDSPEYQDKLELMAPYINTRNVAFESLPTEIAYHVTLLKLFTNCTIGRLNITTTESKLQACFNYVDVILAILDPGTISIVKINLARFLLNACVDVEIKIPGFSHSGCVWQLLKTFPDVLHYAKDELRIAEKLGWNSVEVNRHEVEYSVTCVMIVASFFELYYEPSSFQGEDVINSSGVQMSESDINLLISQIFHKIKDIYEIDSPRLTFEQKSKFFRALQALNRSSTELISTEIQMVHTDTDVPESLSVESIESRLLKKYQCFTTALGYEESVQQKLLDEVDDFIRVLDLLPDDSSASLISRDLFISKIASHIRSGLEINELGEKSLNPAYLKTSIWYIQLFRKIIEFRMGMSITERDDDGGEEQDLLAKDTIALFNRCGVTTLCLDLIAVGIDDVLQIESIRLAVALLFKEGGALEVQQIMNHHLRTSPTSHLFFAQLKITLQKLISWHKWNHITKIDQPFQESESCELHNDIILVRFLQLMCEGHYLPNQDIIRDQGLQSVNLLDDLVMYLNDLSRMQSRLSTSAAIRVAATILEVVQGPCKANQSYLTMKTELIETLNRILRTKPLRDFDEDEEMELKKSSIDILQGLLEGQGARSNVYDRIISVLHFDVIDMLARPPEEPEEEQLEDQYESNDNAKEISEDEATLRTESMVLLQMLCAYQPKLYDHLKISRNINTLAGSSTAVIEVFWRGELHRKIFNIPKICKDLAKTTRDGFVEDVDRSSMEAKLIDLMKRTREMYREVKHQQDLKALSLGYLFSPENFDRVTWISFLLSMAINAIFICYYSARSGTPTINDPKIVSIINAMNIMMTFSCGFTVVQLLFVKTPVKFRSLRADGYSLWNSVLYTATDNQTIYYFGYLIMALLGYLVTDLCLPLLLLDIIVKNSTTRDVLNSITKPWKQLTMTLVLCVFLLYIFAYFMFFYFRFDFPDKRCFTLWDCAKFMICTASRQPGGVGDNLNHTIGPRWYLDFFFFISVVLIILKIVFGIIIDTFSSLRSKKNERLADTKNICFICGIDKQTFDRASKEPEGFQRHVKLDHNLWNYVYFMILLWEQDKDDDDGLEWYVRKAIDTNEIYWFPMNKAICLEQNKGEKELSEVRGRACQSISSMENLVLHQLFGIHSMVKSFSENISRAVKQDSFHQNSIHSICQHLAASLTNSDLNLKLGEEK